MVWKKTLKKVLMEKKNMNKLIIPVCFVFLGLISLFFLQPVYCVQPTDAENYAKFGAIMLIVVSILWLVITLLFEQKKGD